MVIPDIISEHNYRAVRSKNPRKAAKVQANNLRNKIKAVLQSGQIDADRFSYVDWKADVETCPKYHDTLEEIKILYKTNQKFHTDVTGSTQVVLEGMAAARGQHQIKNIDTEEGVNYLIKELAFFASLPEIFTKFSSYTFVYHAEWPVLTKFLAGMYDGITRPCLNFFILQKQK